MDVLIGSDERKRPPINVCLNESDNHIHKSLTDTESEAPMSNRTLLLLSKGVSYIGTKLFSFALSWYILSQTGSGLSFSISLVVNYLPAIAVSLVAGRISGRVRRPNRVLALCDIASACVCVIPLLRLDLAGIYATIFFLSCISALFNNIIDTHLPNLEGIGGAEGLKKLASSMQLITSGVNILAPALGGVLVKALPVPMFALLNVASFLLSAFGEVFLNYTPAQIKAAETGEETGEKPTSVLRYLFGNPKLRTFCIGDGFGNFCVTIGINVALPLVITGALGISSGGYGLITSCLGVGSVCSALYHTRRPSKTDLRYPYLKTAVIGMAMLLTAGLVLLPYHPVGTVAVLCALQFATGWMSVAINIKTVTTLQLYVDDALRGKVLGTMTATSYILIPLALVLAGAASEVWPVWLLPAVSGGLLLLGLGVLKLAEMVH